MTDFHEEQRFRDSWLWLIVLIPFVVALSAMLATPRTPSGVVVLVIVVAVGVALLIGLARLETTVTSDAVVVTFHGLWPTRRIKLDDIAEYAPMHYGMWDSGGWGIHFGLAGLTYNVSGNEGVHFRLKRGGRVLVGTQRPAEFAAAIAKAMRARPTG
ncbi:MAG TPA: hypothetical protein VGS17_00630 [Candidatus Limnocylindria bacterium]|nr:hypothetical protein [Candidatus Limnocylindria bacterium]